MTKNITTIHTDGGSRGNPGVGAWGVVIRYPDGHVEEYSGADLHTTNNRMELTAAIEALRHVQKGRAVALYTDSTYVRDGITKWITAWKNNGWKTAAKKDVKNKDLWQKLDTLAKEHDVTWHWVKGHDGDEGNERADALCNHAMDMIAS